jgi:hypothetical protein
VPLHGQPTRPVGNHLRGKPTALPPFACPRFGDGNRWKSDPWDGLWHAKERDIGLMILMFKLLQL